MQVFIQMPTDTPFKPGDIYVERGYCIAQVDEAGKAVPEDLKAMFLRPVNPEMVESEVAEMAVLLEIKARMKVLAKKIESL